jgi:large subunit ribosomal protein L21
VDEPTNQAASDTKNPNPLTHKQPTHPLIGNWSVFELFGCSKPTDPEAIQSRTMFASSSLFRASLSASRVSALRSAFVAHNATPASRATLAMKSQTRASSRGGNKMREARKASRVEHFAEKRAAIYAERSAEHLPAAEAAEESEPEQVGPSQTVVDHCAGEEMNMDPNQPMFVVAQFPGRQHKLVLGDQLNSARIPQAVVGEPMLVDNILCVGTQDRTVIGRPTVRGASVTFWVEEQTRDEKVIVFKRKRRNRNQSLNGHKRLVTMLRVVSIDPGPEIHIGEQTLDWFDEAMDRFEDMAEKRDVVIEEEKEKVRKRRQEIQNQRFQQREAYRAEQKALGESGQTMSA